MSTAILLASLLALLLVSLALQAWFLRWGLRWARMADITLTKSVLLILVFFAASSLIAFVVSLFTPGSPQGQLAIGMLELAAQVIVPCAILAKLFKARFLRALQAWLPILIPGTAMVALAYFVFRPYAFEAFIAPTNSMAPTILGNHAQGVCPRCGAPAYGAIPDRAIPADGYLMMCSNELRSCKVASVAESTGNPDRFLVCKLIAPRRWDVVVFRLPSDPAIYYVKRIVGLPGEELALRDGAVWIDGKKLDPPSELRGIEYLDSIDWGGIDRAATGSSPVKLGPDEYFVLGDFSAQAADSRFWTAGAPGHPPYAVPGANMVGVVTHIYWPIDRWRILR